MTHVLLLKPKYLGNRFNRECDNGGDLFTVTQKEFVKNDDKSRLIVNLAHEHHTKLRAFFCAKHSGPNCMNSALPKSKYPIQTFYKDNQNVE